MLVSYANQLSVIIFDGDEHRNMPVRLPVFINGYFKLQIGKVCDTRKKIFESTMPTTSNKQWYCKIPTIWLTTLLCD